MALRYPGERELKRDGVDEGAGRGFDLADLSAEATRLIATPDTATTVVEWFARELANLGWAHTGDGWLSRGVGESFLCRVDWDRGRSRVAEVITDRRGQELQLSFEREWFAGVPTDWSVLTLSYTVAPLDDAAPLLP
jgi:hypothetical protein